MRGNVLDAFVAENASEILVGVSLVAFVCISVGFCVFIWRDVQEQIDTAHGRESDEEYEVPLFDEDSGEPLNNKARKLVGKEPSASLATGIRHRTRHPLESAGMLDSEVAMAGFPTQSSFYS